MGSLTRFGAVNSPSLLHPSLLAIIRLTSRLLTTACSSWCTQSPVTSMSVKSLQYTVIWLISCLLCQYPRPLLPLLRTIFCMKLLEKNGFASFSLPRPGTNRHSSCSCPIRLAAGNADSVIGKLRSIVRSILQLP